MICALGLLISYYSRFESLYKIPPILISIRLSISEIPEYLCGLTRVAYEDSEHQKNGAVFSFTPVACKGCEFGVIYAGTQQSVDVYESLCGVRRRNQRKSDLHSLPLPVFNLQKVWV